MDTFMDKLAQRLTAQEMIRANTVAETEELNQLKGQIGEYHECLRQMKAVNEQMSRLVNDQIAPEIYKLVEAGVLRMSDAQADTAGLTRIMEENRVQLQKFAAESAAQLQKISDEGVAKLENAKVDTTGINQLVEESRTQIQAISEESQKKLQDFSEESQKKLQDFSEESQKQLQTISEESYQKLQEMQQNQLNMDEIKNGISEQLQESNDNVHRECVKVYRNVQAIVVEESGKQTENVNESVKLLKGKLKAVFGLSIGALVISVLGLAAQILDLLHVF